MSLVIGFLTFILVMDCLFLMLLILIQLPKKEAGAGIAFGGAATDALFGAGSGNALTKMTKYAGTIFLGLALSLSLLNSHHSQQRKRGVDEELLRKQNAQTPLIPPPLANTNASQPLLGATQTLQSVTVSTTTNVSAAISTNHGVSTASTDAAAPNPAQPATVPQPAATNQATPNSPGPAPK